MANFQHPFKIEEWAIAHVLHQIATCIVIIIIIDKIIVRCVNQTHY